jgi:cobalt-zinc-cadmium efflux system outer membrane protein
LRLELAGELRDAWWALAAARNAKELAVRRLDTARALEADVRRRYTVGELSRIDANLAQGEVHAAGAELIESEATLLQAEQALRTLTGAVAPEDMAEEAPTTLRTSGGTSAASETHPLLMAAAAASRSARARVTVADESRRAAPELALRVVRERDDDSESYGNTVGIRLKIPFSSGPRCAARLRRHRPKPTRPTPRCCAPRRASGSKRNARSAPWQPRSVSCSWRRSAFPSLPRTCDLNEKAFSLGESDLATLLRIRAAAFDAESFLGRQRVARAAAISRLNQAMGVLP